MHVKRIVLATGNPHKIAEIDPILKQYGIDAMPQKRCFKDEAVEDGVSFLENALIKARFASEKTGLPALADDSGLEVKALSGRPGVLSARYAEDGAGKPVDDEHNLLKVLDEMKGLPWSERQARYVCAMVFVRHAEDPTPLIGMGYWNGEILTEKRTDYGIGYDPIMWFHDYVKAGSEIALETKLEVSHRTKALNAVLSQLDEWSF